MLDDNSENCAVVECAANEYLCLIDNFCVPRDAICNGVSDCSDASDEVNCASSARHYMNNKKMKWSSAQPTVTCPDGSFPEFSLHGSTYCWSDSVCPPNSNCMNGQCCRLDGNGKRSIEIGCASDMFRCDSGDCIPKASACNRHYDCADGSDELKCEYFLAAIRAHEQSNSRTTDDNRTKLNGNINRAKDSSNKSQTKSSAHRSTDENNHSDVMTNEIDDNNQRHNSGSNLKLHNRNEDDNLDNRPSENPNAARYPNTHVHHRTSQTRLRDSSNRSRIHGQSTIYNGHPRINNNRHHSEHEEIIDDYDYAFANKDKIDRSERKHISNKSSEMHKQLGDYNNLYEDQDGENYGKKNEGKVQNTGTDCIRNGNQKNDETESENCQDNTRSDNRDRTTFDGKPTISSYSSGIVDPSYKPSTSNSNYNSEPKQFDNLKNEPLDPNAIDRNGFFEYGNYNDEQHSYSESGSSNHKSFTKTMTNHIVESDFPDICSDQEFRCPYIELTVCVHYGRLCDGTDDCGDGSDEVNCDNEDVFEGEEEMVPKESKCHDDQYECTSGSCIAITDKCNHRYDCDDGSDETICDYYKEAVLRSKMITTLPANEIWDNSAIEMNRENIGGETDAYYDHLNDYKLNENHRIERPQSETPEILSVGEEEIHLKPHRKVEADSRKLEYNMEERIKQERIKHEDEKRNRIMKEKVKTEDTEVKSSFENNKAYLPQTSEQKIMDHETIARGHRMHLMNEKENKNKLNNEYEKNGNELKLKQSVDHDESKDEYNQERRTNEEIERNEQNQRLIINQRTMKQDEKERWDNGVERLRWDHEAQERSRPTPEVQERLREDYEVQERLRADHEAKERLRIEHEAQKRLRADHEAKERLRIEHEAQERLRADHEAKERLRIEHEAQERLRADHEAKERLRIEHEAQERLRADHEAKERLKTEHEAQEKLRADHEAKERLRTHYQVEKKLRTDQEAQERSTVDYKVQEKLRHDHANQERLKEDHEARERLRHDHEAQERLNEILSKERQNVTYRMHSINTLEQRVDDEESIKHKIDYENELSFDSETKEDEPDELDRMWHKEDNNIDRSSYNGDIEREEGTQRTHTESVNMKKDEENNILSLKEIDEKLRENKNEQQEIEEDKQQLQEDFQRMLQSNKTLNKYNGIQIAQSDHKTQSNKIQIQNEYENEENSCLANEFQCNNGKCIDENNVCNGIPECFDGSDELHCSAQTVEKSPDQNVDDDGEQHQSSSSQGVQLTIYPTEVNVRIGGEGTFDCRARSFDGNVYPEVRWSRYGGGILSPSAHQSDGRLTFKSVSKSDSGRYVCTTTYGGLSYEAFAQFNVQSYGPQDVESLLPSSGVCRADERTCDNNDCVKKEYVCDGEPDCRDRSDEKNCPSLRACEPNEFKCNNGRCIQKMWLCDGDDDCGDRSDEQSCSQKTSSDGCSSTEFRCKDGRQCVPQSFHCDGTNDCHDGSDEIGCVQPTIVQAPETNKQVAAGGTLQLTCKAVAVPEPYVNWRLNWGPVCDPPRCVQKSDAGLGTLTITNAQPLDQGAYTCEAINVKGRVLATPDCIVRIVSIPAPERPEIPEPQPQPQEHGPVLRVQIDPPKSQRSSIGGRVRWYCRVIGHKSPGLRLEWTKVGTNSLPTNAAQYEGELIIDNVQESDAGQYRCTATGDHQFATDDAILDTSDREPSPQPVIGSPPPVMVDPLSQTVNENDPATFRCWVPGLLSCELTWHKGHVGGSLPYGVYQNGGVLKIPQAQLQDAGNYICTASNHFGVGQSVPAELIVNRPLRHPQVDPLENIVSEGEPARFRCWVPGDTDLKLTWKMKGNGPLPEGVMQNEGILNFQRTQRLHAGSYICTASDPDGRKPPMDSPVARLVVKTVNSPKVDPLSQNVNEGDSMRFRCWVADDPYAELYWRRADNQPLGYDARDSNGILSISNAKFSDSGDYICSTRDPDSGHPVDSPIGHLNVERSPHPPVQQQRPLVQPGVQSVSEGNPVEFRCWVLENPNARLKWTRIGGGLLPYGTSDDGSGVLYNPRTHMDDAGYYVCSIIDSHGGPPVESEPAQLKVEPTEQKTFYGKPETSMRSPQIDPSLQTVYEGEPSQIRCFVPGEPDAHLTWRKENGVLPESATQSNGVLYIHRTEMQDTGKYICTSKSSHRGGQSVDSPTAHIIVKQSAPLTPLVDPPTQTVDENSPSRIRCWVPGNSNIELIWSKESGDLPHNAQQSRGVLTIPFTSIQDAGEYICSTKVPEGSVPETASATVNVQPVVKVPLVYPPEQTVNHEDLVRFQCYIPGEESEGLRWSFGEPGKPLPTGAFVDRGVLTIEKADSAHAGEYICTDDTPKGPVNSKPGLLIVNQPVAEALEVDPPVQTVEENARSSIRCFVPGNPNAHLSWHKADGVLPLNAFESHGDLTIPSTNLEDAGEYICTSHRPDGGPPQSKSAVIHVNQAGTPPHPIATPSDQVLKVGEPAKFHCDPHSDTPARVRWGFQGVDNALPPEVEEDGEDLIIHSADESNAGEYFCSASNEYGHGEAEPVRLHVSENEEPPTARVLPRVWNGQPGDRHQFTCITTGIPPPQVIWTSPDGDKLPEDVQDIGGGVLELTNGRTDMNGDYTCTAVNIVGEASDYGSVNIGPSLTIRTTPPGPRIVLTAGEPLEVKCEAFGEPEPEVEWLHDPGPERGDLPDDFKPVTISEQYIRHPGVGIGNSGVYTCKGTNSHASATKDILVSVVEASRVATVAILGGSTQWIDPTRPAELVCTATGNALVDRIQWVKVDDTLPELAEEHGSGILRFSKFKTSYSGEYECRGYRNDELIGSNRVMLHGTNSGPLDAARVEIDSPSVRVVNQGDPIELTCRVEGEQHNEGNFEWTLLRSGSIIRQFSDENTLQIKKVDPSNDYGVYRCEVEDDEGELLGQAFAAVVIGYTDLSNTRIEKFNEGANAVIECPVYLVPGANIAWEKRDGELPTGSEASGAKLMINEFSDDAVGVYLCKVEIDGQAIEGYVKAEIYVPDTIIQVLLESSSESIVIGDRAWFDCKVIGDPEAEILWTRENKEELPENSQVTGNRLLFVNVREEDGGIYKCRAKTKAGPLEARTVLNVGNAKRKRKHLTRRKEKREHKVSNVARGREKKQLFSVFGNWFRSI